MEVELKQRLVGASVIIALAVIFIPMLFDDSKTNRNEMISIEIPDEPTDLKKRVISIDTTIKQESTKPMDIVENTNNSIKEEPQSIKIEETIVEVVKPHENEPKAQSKPKKPLIAIDALPEKDKSTSNNPNIVSNVLKPDDSQYRIKFGAFSQEKNAQQLKAKIINLGYKSHVEKNPTTKLYMVYSSFLNSQKEALNLTKNIESHHLNIGKTSIEKIAKVDVENAEMVLDTGWIVQIGLYSNKENSLKLRDKIRKKGFVCFVDTVINSQNKTFYRVRVGPFATRKEAVLEQGKIKKIMSLKGIIKPHEKQKIVL